MAVWLANEKSNLAGLERPDNLAKVLLFKEAIALGWDCPRAAVLLIFRKLQSEQFTIQTVGRILRMPEQRHYPKEVLNIGYVYTDIAKDRIQIVAADASYILNNTITAKRRKNLENILLPAYYAERPNAERNYLGPDFRHTLYETAKGFWNLECASTLFSFADMVKMAEEMESYGTAEATDKEICENRLNMQNSTNAICLDVKNVDIKLPNNVHFQNEEQTLKVGQVHYTRKMSEINRAFLIYIGSKGAQFESKGRTDKISIYLQEMLADYFGLSDIEAKKVVLHKKNQPKFDDLLNKALELYAQKRLLKKMHSAALREWKEYVWEVPEERVYDSETNRLEETTSHALTPFIQLNHTYKPEKEFIEFLEAHSQWIDWWYKNGDKGKQHFAIPYGEDKHKGLFYVDFIIRMKNGHVYLFDTKTSGSDELAPEKHNALLKYITVNSTDEMKLGGGILIRKDSNWLYSKSPITNTDDTTNWVCFYPELA